MAFTFETIPGLAMISIGMGAFAFVLNAKNKSPEGTELRHITTSFIPVIISLILFSLWHTAREVFELKHKLGEIIEYPAVFSSKRNLYRGKTVWNNNVTWAVPLDRGSTKF